MAQRFKYNGKELNEELGLNMYDYGARFYDPAVGRWFTPDALAEKYYSDTTYGYALGNPIIYIDPDGNAVEMCCDGAKAFILTMVDNTVGSNLRNKYDTGSQGYRNGVTVGHSTSMGLATVMTVDGLISTSAGTTGLAASGVVTAGSGGTATPVTGITAAASGLTLLKGIVETAIGVNMGVNTVNNMKSDASSDNSSSNNNSSESSTSQKTGEGRGSNNRTRADDAVGDHTVTNENGSTTYKVNQNNPNKNSKGYGFETTKRVDYKGAAHVDKKTGVKTPTPHVQENGTVRPAIPGKDMPLN